MATETWSLKLDSELKEKIQEIVKKDFESSQEFMEQLLNAYQNEKLNNNSDMLKGDIDTVNRAIRQIQDVFIGVNAKLGSMEESYNQRIQVAQQSQEQEKQVYRENIEKLKSENEKISQANDKLVNINNELTEQVEQFTKSNSMLEQLVNEYKEKNDTLTGLLAEYKADHEANKNLKDELNMVKADKQKVENEVETQGKEIDKLNTKLIEQATTHENELQTIKSQHSVELGNATKQAEIDANMRILELQAEQQKKLNDLQEKHNAEIEQYQIKYKELLEEMEQKKTKKMNEKELKK